jgi:hypothetical protein
MGLKAMSVFYNKIKICVSLVSIFNFNFNVEFGGQTIFLELIALFAFTIVILDPRSSFLSILMKT